MTGPQKNPQETKSQSLNALRVQFKNWWFSTLRSDSVRAAKVWVVLAAISLLLIFGGHKVGRFGLLVGFLLALAMNTIVYFYADIRIASLFTGQELEGQDPWGLRRQTLELARAIGVKAPALVVIESSTPLAFSAGLLPQQSKIYLSTELLKRLTADEIRIVLAYELHRLKTQQTSSATAASALVGLITLTASAIDDILLFRWIGEFFPNVRAKRETLLKSAGILLGPMTLLVSPLVALLVRLSVSRKALIASDRVAGETTRTGAGLVARTLWKLDSYAKTRPFPVNLAEAHLFTVSPLTRYPMWKFASAQPPIEARLKALTGYEPL
jgi:Zn-dependent protease with chaperone function